MRARVAAAILLGCVLIAAGVAYFVASTSTGTVAIQLRDAPVAWSHVVVTFSQASILPAGATNGGGWVYVAVQSSRIDLLSLGNQSTLLAQDHVAPGGYTQLRILVSSVSGVLSTGAPVVMSVSDGALVVTTPFAVHGGQTTTVTIDLNLTSSIQQTSQGWAFVPSVRSVTVTCASASPKA